MADSLYGFVACAVSAICFGTAAVPIKKFKTGDGLFYQWVFCGSIWVCGLVVNIIRNFPPFCPLGILGGAIWALGNLLCVPTIHCIGLAKGILLWVSVNMVVGWAAGRFGFPGIPAEIPNDVILNYAGVACCLVATIGYTFIKSSDTKFDDGKQENSSDTASPEALLDSDIEIDVDLHQESSSNLINDIIFLNSKTQRQIVGIVFAITSGTLYGVTFLPIMYHQANIPGASKNGLDYVFSYFCGIFLASSFFFTIYCAIKKNKPTIYPEVILPGFVAGILWAVADAGWFVANATLSEAISFPIILMGPGIIATLWGIFLFKEISGLKNFIILFSCITIGVIGAVLTGLSKA